MVCRSCLNDPNVVVAADTSVAININATRHADKILKALPNRLVVVEEVSIELEDGRKNGRKDADQLSKLISAGLVEVVQLNDKGLVYFERLVSGTAAQTLDDGEAATIAYALEQGAIALIDERKANRICASQFPELVTGCTGDILVHEKVESSLGRNDLSDAVFNALFHGRMRVFEHHTEWIINLIGFERAAKCASLARMLKSSDGKFS